MDATRPQPLGQASAVKSLRRVVFGEILGAASVRPKGLMRVRSSHLLGAMGVGIAMHATDPLPPKTLLLAVTPGDIRIFLKPLFSYPVEIGRWKRGTYMASLREGGLSLKLDLDLDRLGRVRLMSQPGFLRGGLRPVFELVVQFAAGPVP